MTHPSNRSLLASGHEYETVTEGMPVYLSESLITRYAEKWDSAVIAVRNMFSLEDDWNGMGALAPRFGVIESAVRLIQFYRQCGSPGPDRVIASPMGTVVFEWLQSLGNLTEVEVTDCDICEWFEYRDGKITDQGQEQIRDVQPESAVHGSQQVEPITVLTISSEQLQIAV